MASRASILLCAPLAGLALGCGGGGGRADVTLSMSQTTTMAEAPASLPTRIMRVFVPVAKAQVPGCPPAATACVTPSELSVKLTTVYLSYDIDPVTGSNVGPGDGSQPDTQAVYASPNCPAIVDSTGASVGQPNLGNCGIDVGLTSSSTPPQEIVASPGYIDLAEGTAAVNAALDASTFGVAVGSYSWLRMDIGSNAEDAPPQGSQDTAAEGVAMNMRFFVEGMTAPYEIRRTLGIDVEFEEAIELAVGDVVDLEVTYNIEGTVAVYPDSLSQPDPNVCTPAMNGNYYCLEAGKIGFVPSITVTTPAP